MPRSPPEKAIAHLIECLAFRDCIKCAMHTQEVAYGKNTNDTGG